MKILIVVASSTGRTRRVGEAVAEGARDAGASVLLRRPEEARELDFVEADAVVLGSPVQMGGMHSSLRALLESTAPHWLQGRLVGKLGAAFATAADGERGGSELTLLSMLSCLAEHGMLLVPMHSRLPGFRVAGSQWGPMVRTRPGPGTPDAGLGDDVLEAARSHGRWVAESTARWLAGARPG